MCPVTVTGHAGLIHIVWTLISPEVALLLIMERGWTLEEYGDWLGQGVTAEVAGLNGAQVSQRSR